MTSARTCDYQPRSSVPAAREALEARADQAADRAVAGRQTSRAAIGSKHSPVRSPASVNQSAGSQLKPATRARLETSFGADFSTVRIHADGRAAEAADRMGARAYADGEAIVFAGGHYRPDSSDGLRLIAHEAAHILQQRAGAGGMQLKPAAKPKPADYKTVEEAEKALQAKYGVAGIKNGASNWSVAELNTVYDSLGKLPAGDVAALKGVTLTREKTLTKDAPDAAPVEETPTAKKPEPLDGKFVTRQSIDTGATEITNEAEVQLADSAFKSTAQTEETLLHEAGHAVASKAQRDAVHGQLKATAKFNQRVNEQAGTASALTAAAGAMNPVATEANAIATEVNGLVKERGAAKTKSEKTAIDAKIKELQKKHAELTKTLTPLREAHKKAEAADKTAVSKKDAAEQARAAAATAADMTKAASGETVPVQRFVDFVNEKKIDPITKYAADNWPSQPEEFYAEAYSLFLTNPAALKEKSSDLFDWFKGGKYK